MTKLFSTLGNYLTQRTTYTGAFTLLAVYGLHISTTLQTSITDVGMLIVQSAFAVAGLINILHNEKADKK